MLTNFVHSLSSVVILSLYKHVYILRYRDDDKIEPIPCVSEVGKLLDNKPSRQHLDQTFYCVENREDNSAIKHHSVVQNTIQYNTITFISGKAHMR